MLAALFFAMFFIGSSSPGSPGVGMLSLLFWDPWSFLNSLIHVCLPVIIRYLFFSHLYHPNLSNQQRTTKFQNLVSLLECFKVL